MGKRHKSQSGGAAAVRHRIILKASAGEALTAVEQGYLTLVLNAGLIGADLSKPSLQFEIAFWRNRAAVLKQLDEVLTDLAVAAREATIEMRERGKGATVEDS